MALKFYSRPVQWAKSTKFNVALILVATFLAVFSFVFLAKKHSPDFGSITSRSIYSKDTNGIASKNYAGPEWFDAYHRLIRTKSGERGPDYPIGYRFKEFRKSMSSQNRSISGEKLDWIERGPSNAGGRTRSIWIDPSDSTHLTWFVGSVSGGVWKTENGGNNWNHLTKDLTNLATSVIAGSQSNADILYIGTGEGYSNSITGITGNGIWKSIDKGNNWFPLESTVNNPKFAHIMRIAVNQDNENELVVASRLGRIRDLAEGTPRSFLHRSTDGGLTWAETWHDTLFVQQVISHPGNFDTLFAAVNSGGVLRSSDKGVTWRYVADWQADTLLQRLELAISPTNPNLVYAVSSEWRWRIFLSSDSGNNWREVRPINPLHTFSQLGGQGFWNNAVAVHPFEDYVLFVGGQVSILKITIDHTSGGVNNEPFEATTEVIANVWEGPSQNVHVDHHNLTLIPIDIDLFYIINANDGGIAFSRDGGNSFTQTGDTNNRGGNHPSFSGYNVTQFYGVDKMNGADRYVGGTQDNSNWISPLDPDSSSHWLLGPDGDGFETIWHYSDPNKLITTTHYSQIHRSDDGGVSWSNVSPAGPGCFFGVPTCSFFSLIAGSKIEPDLVYTVSKSGVLRSLDFAENWEVIRLPAGWKFSEFANIIRSSVASQRIVWTGSGLSEEDRLFVSDDGGSSFVEANIYDQAELGILSGLCTHPTNKNTAYALFSAANAPKILRTTDLGGSWMDISGFEANTQESNNGFPDVATYSLLVMPFDTNRIWAGTEIGLFESLNGGISWHYSDNGLPPVAIWEMKIVNDEIVLATHGRGVWTVSFPELEGYEPPAAIALLPILEVKENALGGVVSTSYTLRSDYDSAFMKVEAQGLVQPILIRFPIEPNLSRDSSIIAIEGLSRDTIVEAKISLECYKAGEVFRDVEFVQVYEVESEPRYTYENDFDQDLGDVARLDFHIYQEEGFESKALHTLHPYKGFDQTYLAVLTVPIIVLSSDATMTFDEIVMVEPGHQGTVLGDRDFFDYVAIEGTSDKGKTWRVIEAYDARWSQNWQSNFEPDAKQVDPQLVETHELDLASTFNPGDTIFLRFRLQSDLFVEGWGWMVDNLRIQENPTSIAMTNEPELEMAAFPNPTNDHISLRYDLTQREHIQISIGTVSGQILSVLGKGEKPAGSYQIDFDASAIESGVYIFQIRTRRGTISEKWIKW